MRCLFIRSLSFYYVVQEVVMEYANAACGEIFFAICTAKISFSACEININSGHIALRVRAHISQRNPLY